MKLRYISLFFITLGMTAVSHAGIIDIQSNNAASSNEDSFGGFVGTMSYDWSATGMSTLSFELENTSQFDGYLTGIAFDDSFGDWSFNLGDSSGISLDWQNLEGPIDVQPFGSRDFGASSSDSWMGGGTPGGGLAAGETGTFVFTSANAANVTARDFFNNASSVFRFRGFTNGASDKLPGQIVVVPAPGALAVICLACFVGSRRRR